MLHYSSARLGCARVCVNGHSSCCFDMALLYNAHDNIYAFRCETSFCTTRLQRRGRSFTIPTASPLHAVYGETKKRRRFQLLSPLRHRFRNKEVKIRVESSYWHRPINLTALFMSVCCTAPKKSTQKPRNICKRTKIETFLPRTIPTREAPIRISTAMNQVISIFI